MPTQRRFNAHESLTITEAMAVLNLLPDLPADHAITIANGADGAMFSQIAQPGRVLASVSRINGHLCMFDHSRDLGGASGEFPSIKEVVDALRVTFGGSEGQLRPN